MARLSALLSRTLVARVPRNHQEPASASRRRRIVVAITLVVGTLLLASSLRTAPGDASFYALTGCLAIVWVLGGFASGPLHLGCISWRDAFRRPLVTPLVIGLLAAAGFLLGALAVREIASARGLVTDVLDHEQRGNTVLVYLVASANGVAEEIFFRGALFAAIGRRRPVTISTVVYALTAVATLNLMLIFAAVLMGTLFGLQRLASGGVLAPVITHVTWSAVMVAALPPLLAH